MMKYFNRLGGAFALMLVLSACGGSDSANDSAAGSDSGGEAAELSATPTAIEPDAMCALLTDADFGAALSGELVTSPSEGSVQNGCSWSDDDGKLIELAVTTFESADDLSSYRSDLEGQTTIDVAGFDVVATNVGDFVTVGLTDRYQVVGLFTADDVPDELATTVVTRWREAAN